MMPGAVLALPALRVKGPYLPMITIAFGFVVAHSAVELRGLTGGQNGLMGIMGPAFGEVRGERAMATIAVAAESIGLQPLALKTVAFAVSAALAGLAGGLYVPLSGFVTPQSLGFSQSLLFFGALLLVVLWAAPQGLVGLAQCAWRHRAHLPDLAAVRLAQRAGQRGAGAAAWS